jgi:hypothetical protein
MTHLHEPQISKTRKIVGYILSILPSGMILITGIMKLSGSTGMEAAMGEIPNFGEVVFFIGLIELACLLLYWIPATSNIGFFLLCSYTGGLIVAEIVSDGMPIAGILISVLFYVGTILRKPSLLGLEI